MSLINDALKRASEAEKRRAGIRPGARRGPKGPEALGPPIEPVKKRGPELMSQPSFWMAMFTITLVLVSGAFFYTWWTARTPRFKLHVPEGKDPLEMMIVSKPKPKVAVEAAPIVVGPDGKVIGIPDLKGDTNAVSATNSVVLTPETNAIAPPVLITNAPPVAVPDTRPALTDVEPVKPDVVVVTNAPTILKPTGLPSMGDGNVTPGATVDVAPDKLPGAIVEPKSKPDKIEPFPEITLKGIVIMKDKATAFVNGKTMKVGEHVGGAELVEIGIEYVKFKRSGEVRQFYLLR
jgi:hypothetical protein